MTSGRSFVISQENIIKKDVTKQLHPSFEKYCVEKKVSYANKDSRELIVAAYDSCAGEPSETVYT